MITVVFKYDVIVWSKALLFCDIE